MTDKLVQFVAELYVPSKANLLEAARTLKLAEPSELLTEILCALTVAPDDDLVSQGVEIVKGTHVAALEQEKTYRLRVVARVFDEDAFLAAALTAYRRSWRDYSWRPATLSEALFELVLGSNSAPSPDVLGFNIKDWQTVPDSTYEPTPF